MCRFVFEAVTKGLRKAAEYDMATGAHAFVLACVRLSLLARVRTNACAHVCFSCAHVFLVIPSVRACVCAHTHTCVRACVMTGLVSCGRRYRCYCYLVSFGQRGR